MSLTGRKPEQVFMASDMHMRFMLILLLSWLPAAFAATAGAPVSSMGGAACVMAKWQGNTLDYALVMGKSHPVEAQKAAEQMLAAKGYDKYGPNIDIRHAQAVTNLPHAYVIVLKTIYKTSRGKERTSYGCGFSAKSHDEALWAAMQDLQSYSWGWKPDRDGYQVIEKTRY